jgi:hypothetical protein
MEYKLVSELGLSRAEFEKAMVALQVLTEPFKLNKKMRVTMDYDPQKPMVQFKFFNQAE